MSKLTTKEEYADLLSRYDAFLFDCDGVLWSGDDLIPGAKEVLSKLRSSGKQVVFVTNNASKSRRSYKGKFDKMGIEASESEIISSSYAAAVYLKDVLKMPADRKVYVLGMDGIEEELNAVGIQYCGGTDPDDNRFLPALDFSSLQSEEAIDPSVGAVLCGFDMHMSYIKLAKAFKHITRPGAEGPVEAGKKGGGCHFILTNDDSTFPAKGGPWPGAGSLSAPLIFASKRKPTIVGKPHQPMLDTIESIYNLDKPRTLFIGDRLDTDIAFANNGGIDSLLVLTGISTVEDCDKQGIHPKYVLDSIGNLNV
ncbi:putative 4-nitrophenylphosphatase [Acaromyces ingoldii]|uniref:4-nitrophenylphosphatase n=1 Tax=Acaromyces ingoldii TaxID=215250 RepID=A0A316YT19_9BASI|nr:putative 4-nitrophenylphosphatase [Acaromyces ingoldii]PWN91818.1 putative 4-nitrophenylphosphatase [Acaromyces ingoldii]